MCKQITDFEEVGEHIGFTTMVVFIVMQVLQNKEIVYTMSTVQVKVWNVLHSLVKFLTASHLEDLLVRHEK